MNLNYTYGWHPVSLAMPLMFAAIYGAVTRRWVTAAVCALLACSFNEAVLVALGCVAAAMVVSRVVQRGSDPDSDAARITEPVSGALSIAGWVAVWAVITVGFVLVWKFAGFSQFQQDRLASQLSWRHAIRIESVWFVLGLLTPVGVSHLGRAWPISLAIVVTMGVLLTWSYEHSTSLAFPYTSTLAPGLFVAAIAGASVRTGNACATEPHSKALTRRAAAVLATTLVATSLFGAWPWSRPTLHLTEQLIYPGEQFSTNPQRAPGSAGIAALGEAVALASHPDAAVLATGYIAPHLLRVRRLEPLNEAANERAAALAAEAGEGRQWFELFDWIVLDTQEDFQQGMSLAKDVTAQALEAGYEIAFSRHGVIVLKSGQVVAR